MSEKIKNIADISHGLAVQEYYTRLAVEHPSQVIFYDIFNQQFAELIVAECAAIANKTVIGSDFVGEAIQKHFGVS